MILSNLLDLRVYENIFLNLLFALLSPLDERLCLAHGLLNIFYFSLGTLLLVHQLFAETAHDNLRSFSHI